MKTGSFSLILGCMFSGKTSELINRYNRFSIGGKSCIMIKYLHDNRYSVEQTVTHDGIHVVAERCEYLYQMDHKVEQYDAIFIDEVQFYKDGHIFCDKWANEGKTVVACGLNGTSNRKPFDIISKLLPLVDNLTYLKAICRNNGEDATFSKRVVEETGDFVIGGADKYTAVDRTHFFNSNPNRYLHYLDEFSQFADVICKEENSNLKYEFESWIVTNTPNKRVVFDEVKKLISKQ